MSKVEYDKKELFKNWDECGVDLEGYNRAIREKVNKIELTSAPGAILKSFRYD